jgi:hypothetical protein
MNAPAEEAEAHAKVSKRENRIYVGNLAYDCNYKDLEKFMSGGAFGFLDWTGLERTESGWVFINGDWWHGLLLNGV